MLNIIKLLLNQILTNLESGNSNITEAESLEIIDLLKKYTDKTERLSKYSACKYLNVSRAKFDLLVKSGVIPKGTHTVGFKELSWTIKDLNLYKEKRDSK